jgi:hypothetical protein
LTQADKWKFAMSVHQDFFYGKQSIRRMNKEGEEGEIM